MYVLILLTLLGCLGSGRGNDADEDLAISYTLKARWKHDTQAWTQGLLIHNGKLYESTGQKQSYIGVVDVRTGATDKKVILDDKYFGEGIAVLNNKIYQLTWQQNTGFIYDVNTFEKLGEFQYETEGWGLTENGEHLIMSDGTDKLIFLDTTTLKPVKTLHVHGGDGYVTRINELEYVEGYIFANQWETNRILKIDAETGAVAGIIDLTPLAQEARLENPRADVLNGIAWHPGTRLFVVTGKLWPYAYVLELNP